MSPATAEPDAGDEPEDEGAVLLERLKTEAMQQVVDVGFPMTRKAALRVAGHREIIVGGNVLTVNMLVSKMRGDNWRTGTDFRTAIERAWDDVQAAYLD